MDASSDVFKIDEQTTGFHRTLKWKNSNLNWLVSLGLFFSAFEPVIENRTFLTGSRGFSAVSRPVF